MKLSYQDQQKLIIKKDGTVYINWSNVPGFEYLGVQDVESAKITARIDPNYLCRRSGAVPPEIQRLIKTSSFDTII